jgi:hypothetical protein
MRYSLSIVIAVCISLFAGCGRPAAVPGKPAAAIHYHGKFKVVHDSLGSYEFLEIFEDGRYEQQYFESNRLSITNAGRCHLVSSLEKFKQSFPGYAPQRYWTFPVVVFEDYVSGQVTYAEREVGIIGTNQVSRSPRVVHYFSGQDKLVTFLPHEGAVFKRLPDK